VSLVKGTGARGAGFLCRPVAQGNGPHHVLQLLGGTVRVLLRAQSAIALWKTIWIGARDITGANWFGALGFFGLIKATNFFPLSIITGPARGGQVFMSGHRPDKKKGTRAAVEALPLRELQTRQVVPRWGGSKQIPMAFRTEARKGC